MISIQRKALQYPLLATSIAFLFGIIIYHFFPSPRGFATTASALLFFPTFYCIVKKNRSSAFLMLLFLSISLGYTRTALYEVNFSKNNTIYNHIEKETEVVISGTLYNMPTFDGEKTSFLLKSRLLRKKNESSFVPVSGIVKLKLYETFAGHQPGDELIIRCTLSRPYTFGNPGGFNYPAFLQTKGIVLTGYIRSPFYIHSISKEQSLLHSLRYFPERVRCTIRDFIDKQFPNKSGAVYKALLIGDRSGLSKERLETFKASGIMHIFAISGLHLSLVATILFICLFFLLKRSTTLLLRVIVKKMALLATIPFLVLYAMLAGNQLPVLRSLLMVLVVIISFCVQRAKSPFTVLFFAALILLILNPLSLFTVSFQLSFVAVASILLILQKLRPLYEGNTQDNSRIEKYFQKSKKWVLTAMLISCGAIIGTAPLMLYYFNRVSTVGPLANLIFEPLLCCWALPCGLLAIPFIHLAPQVADFLLSMGNTSILLALHLSDFISKLSFSTLWFATPSPLLIICYYTTLLLILWRKFIKSSMLILPVILVLFFLPPRTIYSYFLSKHAELIFLDVGQGSATVVLLPKGKNILVDGGGAFSSTFNVGESVIAPYLWHRGITHLDSIVITHPDADHFNGIPFLLQSFNPDILWTNGEKSLKDQYNTTLNTARKKHIQIKTPKPEEIIAKHQNITLKNINNPLRVIASSSSNDKSLIVQLIDNQISSLLTGDISKRVEEKLLKENTTLKTTILLAPHHGSKTSSSAAFLRHVKPEQIIVSAGRFRPKQFPAQQLQDYCQQHNIPLLNTAKTGAIQISTNGKEMVIRTFRSD